MRALATLLAVLWAGPTLAKDVRPTLPEQGGVRLLTLTISPCMFLDGEQDPVPARARDTAGCARINRATLPTRKGNFIRLRVPAGDYVVRVYNKGVPWPVDFQLKGAHDPSLPKTGGGAIKDGSGADFRVKMTPGVYEYSSPAVASPGYQIIVEG